MRATRMTTLDLRSLYIVRFIRNQNCYAVFLWLKNTFEIVTPQNFFPSWIKHAWCHKPCTPNTINDSSRRFTVLRIAYVPSTRYTENAQQVSDRRRNWGASTQGGAGRTIKFPVFLWFKGKVERRINLITSVCHHNCFFFFVFPFRAWLTRRIRRLYGIRENLVKEKRK